MFFLTEGIHLLEFPLFHNKNEDLMQHEKMWFCIWTICIIKKCWKRYWNLILKTDVLEEMYEGIWNRATKWIASLKLLWITSQWKWPIRLYLFYVLYSRSVWVDFLTSNLTRAIMSKSPYKSNLEKRRKSWNFFSISTYALYLFILPCYGFMFINIFVLVTCNMAYIYQNNHGN